MNDTVKILDKTFVKFISEADIDAAIQKVADQINEEYKDDDPVLLVTLNGAIVFAVDLLKRLTIQCRISCVKLSSYSGTQSTNVVKNLIGLTEDLRGKRVIILEDIIEDVEESLESGLASLSELGEMEESIVSGASEPLPRSTDSAEELAKLRPLLDPRLCPSPG